MKKDKRNNNNNNIIDNFALTHIQKRSYYTLTKTGKTKDRQTHLVQPK